MFNKIFTFALIFLGCISYAQNEPFNCVYNAYLFQYSNVYALNLASGNSILVAENVSDSRINAAAYNSADGFLWGFLQQKPKTLLRIGNDFKATEYKIESIPDDATSSYIGDVNLEGIYYYAKGNHVHKVDLNPSSPNYLTHIGSFELPKSISIHDWAFNANDNNLYTVEKNSNHIYRIDTQTNTLTDLGEVPILKGNNYTYGAVYFDVDGNFYVSANQTGTVYIIRSTHTITSDNTMNSNLFAYGPASASNDGARCPTAPVPVENCANGVDDDGDGLVDCDDPSCSGVSSCPTITITTGANNGGLESNNRLSQKITARNYQRSKLNYNFDKTNAPVYKRKQKYLNASKNELRDFIPYNTIEGTEPIITSPKDLIDLTNADDIFSVDYINPNKETMASILGLKTNDGVYEHTKYICDRLLGGEILSIGTILIDEQSFIKTIIKNPGGEIEHVISFAVRESDNFTYTIESHWNLDKYTKDVSFYNFQIWANTVDNLYALTQTILQTFKNERTIATYQTSTPPKMYVRKGSYKNGTLNLNMVNTYNTPTNTIIKGGIRATETSSTNQINETLNINTYNSKIQLETGSLFDFGFRIEDNKGGTPDDLFVSDGPWGIDDSAAKTTILEYKINPNNTDFKPNAYSVERNLKLKATTSSYVSAYKAFNPRFRAVNLNNFNTLEFTAKGTGDLTIVLMKEGIQSWENQFKHTIGLTTTETPQSISFNDFKSVNSQEVIDTSDVTMIVFLLKADQEGVLEEKEVEVSNIQFTKAISESLSTKEVIVSKTDFHVSTTVVSQQTSFNFESKNSNNYSLKIYNTSGTIISTLTGKTILGINTILYKKPKVTNGVYLYDLEIQNETKYQGKLIFTD